MKQGLKFVLAGCIKAATCQVRGNQHTFANLNVFDQFRALVSVLLYWGFYDLYPPYLICCVCFPIDHNAACAIYTTCFNTGRIARHTHTKCVISIDLLQRNQIKRQATALIHYFYLRHQVPYQKQIIITGLGDDAENWLAIYITVNDQAWILYVNNWAIINGFCITLFNYMYMHTIPPVISMQSRRHGKLIITRKKKTPQKQKLNRHTFICTHDIIFYNDCNL